MPVTKFLVSMVCLAVVSSPVWGAVPEGDRTPRKPPQEAYAACQGKAEGETVSVTTPRGEALSCICRKLDGQLVAMPERMPPPPDGQPGEGPRNR